jgi:putative protein kinase ArgK-like GTPase of G3E family
VKTVATTGEGVGELLKAIDAFREHTSARVPNGGISVEAVRQRARSEHRLREIVSHQFMERLETQVLGEGEMASLVDRITARAIDPYTAARQLLDRATPAKRP